MMMRNNGDRNGYDRYATKVPGPAGHLCIRCAMTEANRMKYHNGCPLAPATADLCPFYKGSAKPKAPAGAAVEPEKEAEPC